MKHWGQGMFKLSFQENLEHYGRKLDLSLSVFAPSEKKITKTKVKLENASK
jgi:hypothetical protein